MTFDSLIPKMGEEGEGFRALLAGKTGCGKTTLGKALLIHYIEEGYPSIIIIDPKGTFKLPGYKVTICNSPEELAANQKEQVLLYRPNVMNDDKADLECYNRILKWILIRGNTLLYIDEAYALSPDGSNYPAPLRGIYTRGREFGISVIACTQRPVSIPRVMYTEAEYLYTFELLAQSDRDRMAEMGGTKLKTSADKHNFWFNSPELREAVYTVMRK
jgi:ABC-type oligopeptide transport system ATPase subunit